MKKGKLYGARPETISKYLNCLTAFQQRSGSILTVTEMTKKFNTNSLLASFLVEKGIIYKKNGYYFWNEVYEPNIKIINGALDYIRAKSKDRYKCTPQSTPTLFDQKKQYKRRVKFEVEKVKEQPNVNNTAQVGVIRKFIKWLW